ncbi:hypothetical protein BDP27DRAFT_1426818 [Rhodocollybia butyracea]|uniref:F-box domain-containing protein n=1 Tax=Rhodocollybia butyracea TaxID=206335 RepID=A0A9P5PHI3_9AGAR|nr:hypothetical protein BDP27DRAFT_1426818 [Rhodocollybia butyracea]
MSYGNHQRSFEPCIKIDNVSLKENLQTWYPATIEELSEVMGMLKLAREDIVDCSAEIIHLISRREELICCTKKLSGLLSPIRRVPDKILCQIFLHCCAENDLRYRKPDLKISFPSDDIGYDLNMGDFVENPEVLEQETKLSSLIQLYLDRSKNHPLTLDLYVEKWEFPFDHPSLGLLTQESNRWKYLAFRGQVFAMFRRPPAQERLSFPSLETVDLDMGVFGWGPWGVGALEEFFLASNINDLRFDAGRNIGWVTTTDYLSQTSTLPTLSSLVVINHESLKLADSLERVMSSLITPSLLELVLEQRNEKAAEYSRQSFHHVNQFFGRSQLRSLTSLVIQGLYIKDQDIVMLLRQVPSLQNLSIHSPNFPDLLSSNPISKFFIKRLHAGRQSPLVEPLVPKLRELTLKVTTQGFDSSSFVDTIASRWLPDETSTRKPGLVCLRLVELHLPGTVDAEPYERLKQFDEAGLRVVVKCQGVDGYIV